MKTFEEWAYKSPEDNRLLKKVCDEVYSLIPGAEIILYGSRARSESGKGSDWDFLILLDQKPSRQLVSEIRDLLYDLELENNTVLSSIVRSRDDWNSDLYSILPFKKTVEREGVVL